MHENNISKTHSEDTLWQILLSKDKPSRWRGRSYPVPEVCKQTEVDTKTDGLTQSFASWLPQGLLAANMTLATSAADDGDRNSLSDVGHQLHFYIAGRPRRLRCK